MMVQHKIKRNNKAFFLEWGVVIVIALLKVRSRGKQPCTDEHRKMQNKDLLYFLPKYDSLFLLSELYSWEHLITTELQTDFAQWLRLKGASCCHEGNQKFLRTVSCQNSWIGQNIFTQQEAEKTGKAP